MSEQVISKTSIEQDLREILSFILAEAQPEPGEYFVLGGSSSEVVGKLIGTATNQEVAQVIIEQVAEFSKAHKLRLAVQCCEHLNRALVIAQEDLPLNPPLVNVRPVLAAGGAFATSYYESLANPCLTEHISAGLGLDIGDSFIGMHLRPVVVPLKLPRRQVGLAHVTAAYSRLKYIGGPRAQYK